MPPQRKAFKPPTTSTSKPLKPTKPAPRRKSAPARHPPPSSSNTAEENNEPETLSSADKSNNETSPLPSASQSDPPPTLPAPLVSKLLHHHFKDNTRMGKDAIGVAGKYIEVFIREAIARAAFERGEVLAAVGKEGGRGVGEDFLEVEDLEKLAPQLLLDF